MTGKFPLLVILILFIAPALVLIKIAFAESVWRNEDRLVVVNYNSDNSADFIIFDNKRSEIRSISVPGDTQMTASHQLGSWKLKSLWALGEQEEKPGDLLRYSFIKTFRVPVEGWSNGGVHGFTTTNIFSIARSTFSYYPTNLTLKDKLRLMTFSLRVKKANKISESIVDYGYLKKERLVDGEEGYLVKSAVPTRFAHAFSMASLAGNSDRLSIVDVSENTADIKNVVSVVEALGAKVFSLLDEEEMSTRCEMRGEAGSLLSKSLAVVYQCEYLNKDTSGGADVEMWLGKGFAEEF